jgi:hypothetical protein
LAATIKLRTPDQAAATNKEEIPDTINWDKFDYGKKQIIAGESVYKSSRKIVHRLSGSKWAELSQGERESMIAAEKIAQPILAEKQRLVDEYEAQKRQQEQDDQARIAAENETNRRIEEDRAAREAAAKRDAITQPKTKGVLTDNFGLPSLTTVKSKIILGLKFLAMGTVTDLDEFERQIDALAEQAEAAGLMEELDADLNAAADKLTELLSEAAKNV